MNAMINGYTAPDQAEHAIIYAIASLQARIMQCTDPVVRQKLRELLNTCKYVSESLAAMAHVPTEEDVSRFQSPAGGAVLTSYRAG